MAENGTEPKANGRTFFTVFGTIREMSDGSVMVDDIRLARSKHTQIAEGVAAGARVRLRIALQQETDGEGRETSTLWLERAKPVKAREAAPAADSAEK